MATDVFSSSDPLDTVDPIQYVTERYKNEKGELDVAKLAAAALAKDKHIKNVESENGELRSEVKTRIGLEEFLTKISNKPNEEDSANKQGNQSPPNDDSVDIEKLVESKLTQIEQNRMKQINREKVNELLSKIWGADTASNFNKLQRDLGMTREELTGLAERSPEAFFRVTGVKTDTPPPPVGIPPSTINMNAGGGSTVRNNAYYRELKKTNPTQYFSAKVQMQMHQDAAALGEKFFN